MDYRLLLRNPNIFLLEVIGVQKTQGWGGGVSDLNTKPDTECQPYLTSLVYTNQGFQIIILDWML
jgi:hypothetical protein